MNEEETLKFRNTCNVPKIIKVIGVGGGGGNAVENMYRTSIHNVSFVICNTDSQALENSPIPVKVQLGEGLGAGNNPEVARKFRTEVLERGGEDDAMKLYVNFRGEEPGIDALLVNRGLK
jgi:cell division protein FtsZ